uniref:Septin-type G domain-containing protein n=1 Tax=Pyxicephalus adspersus TaxID=30357 RepID=A0AAV3A2M4_PYXAD|nr:TPA: hypothetical protein GDO54_015086 [Pyxicephalus adspersus]
MEDIDDTPVFSPTSTHSSPFSPTQNNITRASNGDSQISTGSHQPLYQSRIRISSSCSPSQSPVLKSRITSSLSFNRGTMQMAKTNGSAGQGLTRVSSFQTRLHPSGFSSSGHGSDSESLHSSTSSLECPPPTRPFQPLRQTQNSVGQHESSITMSNVTSPVMKKFSSHGNVFHSEIERPGVRLVPVTSKNHGSLPSLDLHIAEDNVPDLVPSPDAGYPPSEGWSSPTPDYKRPSSRNAKSISREPSFSSSSSSSSPPTDCAPINCDLTSSPSPPPIFGSLQQTTLQKFPSPLQSSFGKPNGSISEQFNKPLPRTQLRVNLNSTPGISSQVNKEKREVTLNSKPQLASIGRSSSLNYNTPMSPISGSRLPVAIQQDSPQESNFSHNVKPSEFNSSSDRLRSLMQRANSFTKADNVQNQYARDALVNEKSTGHLVDPVKNLQESSCYEKPSFSNRVQGNGDSASMAYHQGIQQKQRFPDASLDSRNGVPPIKNYLQSEPQHMVPLAVTSFKQPEGPLILSEDFEKEKNKTTDSGLEDLDHSSRPDNVGSPMEEVNLAPSVENTMEAKICEELGREPFGYVGIDSVLDQMKRKAMKHGFEFNIMVVVSGVLPFNCSQTRRLRPLDLEFMKRLGRIVNVVPVIAKADTLTLEEREEFKHRIRKDLQAHGISVYPQPELDEETTETLLNNKIREKIPFAVVGTDEEHQVNGKRVLGRKTKWGIIEVENTLHCEFSDLRDLLIRSNLQDLKDITHNIHYESYRVSRLNEKMNGVTEQLKDVPSL